ncbi:MAG: YcxB family protein [Erysipelotrichaceae bacterium]
MNQQFTFTLKNEEYLSFLKYQLRNSREFQGKKLLLRTSLPALILCTMIFTNLYTKLVWNLFAIAVAMLWIFSFAPTLWVSYFNHRINDDTLKKMNITGFKEVKIHFEEKQLVYHDQNNHTILYKDILAFSPLEDLFVFQYGKQQTILLPFRVFDNQEQIKAFIKEFEIAWGETKRRTSSVEG